MSVVGFFYPLLIGFKSFITPIMEHIHVKQHSAEDHHYLRTVGRKSSCESYEKFPFKNNF